MKETENDLKENVRIAGYSLHILEVEGTWENRGSFGLPVKEKHVEKERTVQQSQFICSNLKYKKMKRE